MNTLQCEAMDNPVIKVADVEAPARCVVFDKDGTLIDSTPYGGPDSLEVPRRLPRPQILVISFWRTCIVQRAMTPITG